MGTVSNTSTPGTIGDALINLRFVRAGVPDATFTWSVNNTSTGGGSGDGQV